MFKIKLYVFNDTIPTKVKGMYSFVYLTPPKYLPYKREGEKRKSEREQ